MWIEYRIWRIYQRTTAKIFSSPIAIVYFPTNASIAYCFGEIERNGKGRDTRCWRARKWSHGQRKNIVVEYFYIVPCTAYCLRGVVVCIQFAICKGVCL